MNFTPYQIATFSLLALGTILALWKIFIAVKQQRLNYERNRKQATIEVVSTLRSEYRPLGRSINERFGNKPLSNEDFESIEENYETKTEVRRYLGLFENLAVGVRTDTYDLHTLNMLTGRYIIKLYERFFHYIEHRRTHTDATSLYEHLEWLVNQLKAIRKP